MKERAICLLFCLVLLIVIPHSQAIKLESIPPNYENISNENMKDNPTLFPLPTWSLWKITGTVQDGQRTVFHLHFKAVDMTFYKYNSGHTWHIGNNLTRTFRGIFFGTVTPTYIDVIGYFFI